MPVTDKRILQRQQMVLKHLGYYHGKCDGIWGPDTIAAKRAFELSGNFNPGYPNNGLPFNQEGPYPIGIMRDYRNRALITHTDMTEEYLTNHKDDLVKAHAPVDPNTGYVDTPKADPVLDIPEPVTPSLAAPVNEETIVGNDEPSDEELDDVVVEEESSSNKNNHPKFQRHHNKHQK